MTDVAEKYTQEMTRKEVITKPEKSVWMHFLETTSVKGVSRIVKSPSVCLRVMWLIGFMFGSGMAIYYVYSLCYLYFSYKTVFSINDPKVKSPFPDITVCNLSPASAFKDGERLFQNHIDTVTKAIADVKNDFSSGYNVEDIVNVLESLESPTGFIQNLPYDFLDAPDNYTLLMLMECVWKEETTKQTHSCDESYKQVVTDARLGRCLTFHPPPKAVDEFKGLFYLNDFVEVYMPDFDLGSPQSMGGGAILMLHSPGTLPDYRNGINIPPGYHTSVILSTTQKTGLPEPFSDCLEEQKFQFPEGILVNASVRFSSTSCMDLCIQNNVAEKCQCLSPGVISTPELRQKYPFCGKLLADIRDTVRRYECGIEMDDVVAKCNCPRACLEFQYNFRSFQARWPHPSLQVGFYKKYIRDKPYAHKFKDYEVITKEIEINKSEAYKMMWDDKLMRRNFLYVEIRYEDERMDVEYEQRPALAKESLLGNLGGTLNLWVGVSFVTAIELFELCYNLGRRRAMRHINTDQSRGQEADNSAQNNTNKALQYPT